MATISPRVYRISTPDIDIELYSEETNGLTIKATIHPPGGEPRYQSKIMISLLDVDQLIKFIKEECQAAKEN